MRLDLPRSIFRASGLLCAGLALFLGPAAASDLCKAPAAYLFSSDARFVKIDLKEFKVVDVGNLWWLNIHGAAGVIPDPTGREFLLVTRVWKLLGVESPTRKQFDSLGVAVLRVDHRGALALTTAIPPLFGEDGFLDGRFFELDERRLFLTSQREKDGKIESSVGIYDEGYNLTRTVRGAVFSRSCLSSDRTRILTTTIGEPREVISMEIDTGLLRSRSMEEVGSPGSYSRTPVAFSNDCLTLVFEKPSREGVEGLLHVYDSRDGRVLSSIRTSGYADHHFLDQGSRLLVDEKTYAAVLDEQGQSLGLREKKTGKLSLMDAASGRILKSMSLPENGRVVQLSCGGRRAFYLSPGLLTVVDTEGWTVSGRVEVPFQDAHIALSQPN